VKDVSQLMQYMNEMDMETELLQIPIFAFLHIDVRIYHLIDKQVFNIHGVQGVHTPME
jgi:hypothetical protein